MRRFVYLAAPLLLGLLTACGEQLLVEPELVTVPAGLARYHLPGTSEVHEERLEKFSIMRRQVSQAEYAACVDAGECPALETVDEVSAQLPAVGLSWQDASAYAAWLSRRSGHHYRLPRHGEWILAAASAYIDEAPVTEDPRNPARRWLAEYAQRASRERLPEALKPFGGYGSNEHGLQDAGGNVWEWTDTCFSGSGSDFCNIRIAAGRHPSVLSDFERNPTSGACSVGLPPTHLGLRLVREG
ncbi:SUMF1/EgtB/PvdO family nonheme iron enzyme [Stutzerimonas nitrititolerans]|uniref:SUMF1/EgtB/PvdO family nonheme iron enzyme n=1 Tax=Stutzerimonas nitrititolerans TaxID=2482751 RepID=UPI00264A0C74|nr:SUMF1/EgtB/PvdO family nonheme iron enzyme [Stutzerimonas nitrititolerans]